jgi:hypothetical protein
MKIHPVRAELFHADIRTGRRQTDRKTDMMKLIITFHNVANTARYALLFSICTYQ